MLEQNDVYTDLQSAFCTGGAGRKELRTELLQQRRIILQGWVLREEIFSRPGHALFPPWSFGDAAPAAVNGLFLCQRTSPSDFKASGARNHRRTRRGLTPGVRRADLGGQTMYSTLLSINPSGTGPNVFESRVWNRSSPSIQQCPGGTRTVDSG